MPEDASATPPQTHCPCPRPSPPSPSPVSPSRCFLPPPPQHLADPPLLDQRRRSLSGTLASPRPLRTGPAATRPPLPDRWPDSSGALVEPCSGVLNVSFCTWWVVKPGGGGDAYDVDGWLIAAGRRKIQV
jgi:hypothetical protein